MDDHWVLLLFQAVFIIVFIIVIVFNLLSVLLNFCFFVLNESNLLGYNIFNSRFFIFL